MANPFDPRNGGHRGAYRSTYTYTHNGNKWTVETTSYASPDTTTFRTMGLGSNPAPRHFNPNPNNLMGATLDFFQSMSKRDNSPQQHSQSSRHHEDSTERHWSGAPRGDGRFARDSHRRIRDEYRSSRHGRTSGDRQNASQRHHPSRHQRTETRSRRIRHSPDEHDHDTEDDQGPHGNRSTDRYGPMIEALENAVKAERDAVENCKRQLEILANQDGVRAESLRPLMHEFHRHKAAFESASENLRKVQQDQHRDRRQRSPGPEGPRGRARTTSDGEDFKTFWSGFPFNNPFTMHMPGRSFPHFGVMEDSNPPGAFPSSFFDDSFSPLFSSAESSSYNSRETVHQAHTRPTRSTSLRAPASVLQPEEAKRLYEEYNTCWNALAPTDPNVLFPARGFSASALNARDTIWAPGFFSNVSTWSEEAVMRANVQAFFLGVVGLRPTYRQPKIAGQVEMGFEKSQASASQIKHLIDILKKEKSRWHSDRLGRRNGGTGAINEALQKNERARAVFHAVCELMESAL